VNVAAAFHGGEQQIDDSLAFDREVLRGASHVHTGLISVSRDGERYLDGVTSTFADTV
jgi:hypothetical protein